MPRGVLREARGQYLAQNPVKNLCIRRKFDKTLSKTSAYAENLTKPCQKPLHTQKI
jgi:hypothetical protein